jgi:hypothetical protein
MKRSLVIAYPSKELRGLTNITLRVGLLACHDLYGEEFGAKTGSSRSISGMPALIPRQGTGKSLVMNTASGIRGLWPRAVTTRDRRTEAVGLRNRSTAKGAIQLGLF